MPGEDRLTALCTQEVNRLTGIDFIQIVDSQDQHILRVFFIVDPEELRPVANRFSRDPITEDQILITKSLATKGQTPIKIENVINATDDASERKVLEITVREPGDFSLYKLTINDDRIDPFFNSVEFSFKQGCPSVFDCKPAPHECPPDEIVDFPVDYLARDFTSLRNALLDFAAQRYPDWTEKIEADAGVMLAEIMAALGDEFSYMQDRYAREAYLATATQRRSLDRHARLVDYRIHNGLNATTFLQLTVKSEFADGIYLSAGSRVWSPVEDGPPIPFELGNGLRDRYPVRGDAQQFWVHSAWNEIAAHIPDEENSCLPVGTTELYLIGHLPRRDQLSAEWHDTDIDNPERYWIGRWLLLKSSPEEHSVSSRSRRHLVQVMEIEHGEDRLCLDEDGTRIKYTRIQWDESQALPFEVCLDKLYVYANIVPATAGETVEEYFSIRENENIPTTEDELEALDKLGTVVSRAVERQGPLNSISCERNVTFLYSLKETESRGLGWLGDLRNALPEIELEEINPETLEPFDASVRWQYRSSLLDGSTRFHNDFTLDHGTWKRVIGFHRKGEIIEHIDYANGDGFTIRFGDKEFGAIPDDGTVFLVRYRTGPGTKANLPADTITYLTHPRHENVSDLADVLDEVTNPLPIKTGVDLEENQVFKHLAPEAFRALPERAVTAEDYQEITQRLPWVQRAGAQFRWTGSWLSAFVTPDPVGAFELSSQHRTELENRIDCIRQAGREAFVRDPRYVNIDLQIKICVKPSAYEGEVIQRVIEVLTGKHGVRSVKGFFHPDNFTFGTPLRRAALEAAIQAVPGVLAVDGMQIRARGITAERAFTEMVFEIGGEQIIRLQNDRRHPDRGSLLVSTRIEEAA